MDERRRKVTHVIKDQGPLSRRQLARHFPELKEGSFLGWLGKELQTFGCPWVASDDGIYMRRVRLRIGGQFKPLASLIKAADKTNDRTKELDCILNWLAQSWDIPEKYDLIAVLYYVYGYGAPHHRYHQLVKLTQRIIQRTANEPLSPVWIVIMDFAVYVLDAPSLQQLSKWTNTQPEELIRYLGLSISQQVQRASKKRYFGAWKLSLEAPDDVIAL